MKLTPTYEHFEKNHNNKISQLVYCRLAADLDTPVSLMLKLTNGEENSFILESVTGGEIRGRYSIIGMRPDRIWKCAGNESYLKIVGDNEPCAFEKQEADPLTSLRKLLSDSYIDIPKDLPQASAGIFGYLGYDTIRLIENLPNLNPDPIGLPDGVFLRPSVVAVLDGAKGEVILVVPVWHNHKNDAKKSYENASKLIAGAVKKLQCEILETRNLGNPKDIDPPISNFSKSNYLKAVEKAKRYITAGDIFQVVPSQRWTQDFKLPPFSLLQAKEIIKNDLGNETYNSIINLTEPVAAASIAQVHKAQIDDNGVIKDVAIKILRPDIKKIFNEEIDAIMLFAFLIESFIKKTKRLKLVEVVFLLKEITNLEMDLRFEAAAANEYAENTKNDVGFRVPQIYWNYTSENVMTLDWVDGISIRET